MASSNRIFVFTPFFEASEWAGPLKGDPRAHLEVFHAYRPIARIMRCVGMFPMVDDRETGLRIRFQWMSWITVYTLVPLAGLIMAAHWSIETYAHVLHTDTERLTTLIYLLLTFISGILVLLLNLYQAGHFRDYFLKWQMVDRALSIEKDPALHSLGRILGRIVFGLILVAVIQTSLVLLVLLLHYEVSSSPGSVLSLYLWACFNVGILILPDCNFYFLVKAAEGRFSLIRQSLISVLHSPRSDLSREVQACRTSYVLLMSMVNETNEILAPGFVFSCLSNLFQITFTMYRVVYPLENGNPPWLAVKIFFALIAFTKLSLTCFAGSMARDAADRVATVLKKASTVHVSKATKFEIQMFMLEAANNKVDFTASGYFSIDLSFLTTIIGVLATYCITIMQFNTGETNVFVYKNLTSTDMASLCSAYS